MIIAKIIKYHIFITNNKTKAVQIMTIDEIRQVAQSYNNFVDNSKVIMHNVTNRINFNQK